MGQTVVFTSCVCLCSPPLEVPQSGCCWIKYFRLSSKWLYYELITIMEIGVEVMGIRLSFWRGQSSAKHRSTPSIEMFSFGGFALGDVKVPLPSNLLIISSRLKVFVSPSQDCLHGFVLYEQASLAGQDCSVWWWCSQQPHKCSTTRLDLLLPL